MMAHRAGGSRHNRPSCRLEIPVTGRYLEFVCGQVRVRLGKPAILHARRPTGGTVPMRWLPTPPIHRQAGLSDPVEYRADHSLDRHPERPPDQAALPRDREERRLAAYPVRRAEPADPGQGRADAPRWGLGAGLSGPAPPERTRRRPQARSSLPINGNGTRWPGRRPDTPGRRPCPASPAASPGRRHIRVVQGRPNTSRWPVREPRPRRETRRCP